MSNYSPLTNFANKDALSTGDANKRTKGTEITAELNAISTAINSKEDAANKNVNNGYCGLDSSALVPNARLQATVQTTTFQAGDGLVGTPSISFGADTDTGLYRIGANTLGFTVGGVNTFLLNTAASNISAQLLSSTTVKFEIGNANNELGAAVIFAGSAANKNFLVGNQFTTSNTFEITPSTANGGITFTTPVLQISGSSLNTLFSDGAVGTPALTFINDPNTGIYRAGADDLRLVAGGVAAFIIQPTFAECAAGIVFHIQDGGVGSPGLQFANDPDTGIYRVGANDLAITAGGVIRGEWTTVSFVSTVPILNQDGAVGTPAYSFSGDQDSGLYRVGANNFAFVSGGATVSDVVAASTGGLRVADYGSALQVVGFRNIPQNAQTGNYTIVLGDSGKHIYHANAAGAAAYTIPANASVAFDIGTVLTFINRSATSITIPITTDTLTWSAGGGTGTRTLAQYGIATATKITATEWLISGTNLS